MKWIYEKYGVITEKECPECSQSMIQFEELGLKYLNCSNDRCLFIIINAETNKNKVEENYLNNSSLRTKDWFKIGLFNLEALAREDSTGHVNKAVWLRIMYLEAKSLEVEIEGNLLEKIWNTRLSKNLLKGVQREKAKSNHN